MNRKKQFYVYALARPNGSVFYIGKGKERRVFIHERFAKLGRRDHKSNIIRKVWREGGEIQRYILLTTEDEQEAFAYEREMIALHGRENLCNLTDGGEGASGAVISQFARETISKKAKMRLSIRTDIRTAAGDRLRQRWRNPEFRQKMSESAKKLTATPEWLERIREACNRPEVKAKRSAVAKKRFSDPAERARQSAAIKAALANPESRAKKRMLAGKQFGTPEAKALLQQRLQQGRANKPESIVRGERSPNAKLLDWQIEEIRKRHDAGGVSQKQLAKEYGIGTSQMCRIINGVSRRKTRA